MISSLWKKLIFWAINSSIKPTPFYLPYLNQNKLEHISSCRVFCAWKWVDLLVVMKLVSRKGHGRRRKTRNWLILWQEMAMEVGGISRSLRVWIGAEKVAGWDGLTIFDLILREGSSRKKKNPLLLSFIQFLGTGLYVCMCVCVCMCEILHRLERRTKHSL